MKFAYCNTNALQHSFLSSILLCSNYHLHSTMPILCFLQPMFLEKKFQSACFHEPTTRLYPWMWPIMLLVENASTICMIGMSSRMTFFIFYVHKKVPFSLRKEIEYLIFPRSFLHSSANTDKENPVHPPLLVPMEWNTNLPRSHA